MADVVRARWDAPMQVGEYRLVVHEDGTVSIDKGSVQEQAERWKEHSILANRLGWKILRLAGMVKDGDTEMTADPEYVIDRILEAEQYGHGAEQITVERRRQIAEEGYSASHDAGRRKHLVAAALSYLTSAFTPDVYQARPPTIWPWPTPFWKPKGTMRDLVRAGALIAAAIDASAREEAVERDSLAKEA